MRYTIFAEAGKTLDTWIVPVLGGQPRPFLTNASGLTWIPHGIWTTSAPLVLFSELTGRGNQMAIVSSTESRTEHRTVYMPPETAWPTAPISRRIGSRSSWLRWPTRGCPAGWCPSTAALPESPSARRRRSAPTPPGPPTGNGCISPPIPETGTTSGGSVSRTGTPEQVTFGVTQEEGIEFAPDGRSFVTSIGTSQSTVWVHDSRGDRQMTSEGYAFLPSISPDGKKLYYLVRAGGARNFVTGGLWVADLESGQRQRLLPDFQMRHYTISADGQRVVFVASDDAGRTPVWLAALDGRSAPRRLTAMDSSYVAYFGAPGDVVFEGEEKGTIFIYRVKEDGSGLQKMLPTPNLAVVWCLAGRAMGIARRRLLDLATRCVYPAGGGPPTLICGSCSPPQGTDVVPSRLSWTPDGRFLYLKFAGSTYAIPLQPGQMLPPIPASGFPSKEAVAALPGARLVSEESVFPGPNPSVYAFMKVATQRNIYRVPVP